MSESKTCANCGTENSPDSKFCGSCGKPLTGVNNPKSSSKHDTVNNERKKYENKRVLGLASIGVIGIVLITFLLLWLPTAVFDNHYNDGNISFNYPNNLKEINVSQDPGMYEATVSSNFPICAFEPTPNNYMILIVNVKADLNITLTEMKNSFGDSNNSTINGLKFYEFGPEQTNQYGTIVSNGTQYYGIFLINYNTSDANNGHDAYEQVLKSFNIE